LSIGSSGWAVVEKLAETVRHFFLEGTIEAVNAASIA
jgi:hypothetical protein